METPLSETEVTIYTDGGCKPNPGPGGWAALLIFGDHQKELSGAARDTTNNQMELTAAIEALEALKRPCKVVLYTDSTYLKDGITRWMHGWKRNGWKTSDKKPVKNQEYWLRLETALQRHEVTWKWVKGHADNAFNDRVDELATAARDALFRR